jgi:microcystin-dependent protein
MPRNNQGVYTLPAGNPVVPGTLIETTWANPTMSDIAAALTGSLPRDGSAGMTGPLILSTSNPSNPLEAASKAYVQSFMVYATGMPVGAAMPFLGNTPPPGFLICNGQAVSRTTYAELFAVIGTIYGAGDGVSTFNVPDLRNQFIRGKADDRAVGSTQAGSFAAHIHPVSDPGHTHGASATAWQAAHSHAIATNAHSHGVNDPGHSHSANSQGLENTNLQQGGPYDIWFYPGNTGVSGTGISIAAAGNIGGNTDAQQPAVTVSPTIAAATTNETIGSTGGAETVPQNMALIYVVKAVNDTTQVGAVIGVSSSDSNMIAINETNPAIPELVIHSNVAFGTVKLDASGKVPLNQMPTGGLQFLGYFDASSGNLPVGTFNSGDYYAVSVQGTLTVYDPVTLVASPTLVVVGSQLHYVSGSVTNPTGWYTLTVSGATLASDVQFIPGGTISGTNVQLAISELDSETQTALAGKAPSSAATGAGTSFPPSGGISASNVTAAIQELDTETVKLSGGVMTGNLVGTDFIAPKLGIGVSATIGNNFNLDASANNGTMKLARESGQDVMTVDAAGKPRFPQLAQLISSNGYKVLEGGLIVQWGSGNLVSGGAAVTFPLQFPNSVFAISITADQAISGVTGEGLAAQIVNTVAFQAHNNWQVAVNVTWIAIGY